MAKDVRVKIIGDDASFQAAMRRANLSTQKVGSGFLEMGKHIAGGLAAFAGISVGVGLVEESVKAAENAQVAHQLLAQQMKNVGLSFEANAPVIAAFTEKLSKMSGFTQTDLTTAFTSLVRVTKDVGKAHDDLATAVDLARLKHIDLATATSLVTKAQIGMVGGLRRVGIDVHAVTENVDALRLAHDKAATAAKAHNETIEKVSKAQLDAAKAADKAATATAALAQLHKASAGAADAYGHTAAGAMDRFKAATEELQVKLGSALLPAITKVANKALSFIDNWHKAGTTANDVRLQLTAMKDGLDAVATSINDVVNAFGGWGNVFKAAKLAISPLVQQYKDLAAAAKIVTDLFGGGGGGSGGSSGAGGAIVAGLTSGNIGGPGGKVQGHTGPITAGLAAVERVSGGRVNDDYAKSGHATHSYHYKGEAVDLAPDPAVWARLFPRRHMFAELLGPWGLYNWGVQFYDAKLQAEHMNHIHVAYTGGSAAIAKAFGVSAGPAGGTNPGGGGGAVADTTTTPTFKATPKTKKTAIVTGFTLPVGIRTAIAQAALTVKDSADDLKALATAKRFIESKLGSLKGEQQVSALDALKGINDQIQQIEDAATTKQQAKAAAAHAKQAAALKAHLDKLQAAVTAKKGAFESAFGDLVTRAMAGFDRQTARGLADIAAKYGAQTKEEKALAEFQAKRAADDLAKSRATALANASTDEERAALALGFSLDDQEKALKDAADASRTTANAQQTAAENAYNDLRDLQKTQLQGWLDEQQTKLETGKTQWDDFWGELVKKAGFAGTDTASAFWKNFAAAGSTASVDLGGLTTAQVAEVLGQPGGGPGALDPAIAAAIIAHGGIPHLQGGGLIAASGLAVVHRGERVIPAGGNGGGDVHIHIAGSVLTERDLVQVVRDGIKRDARNNGFGGLN